MDELFGSELQKLRNEAIETLEDWQCHKTISISDYHKWNLEYLHNILIAIVNVAEGLERLETLQRLDK